MKVKNCFQGYGPGDYPTWSVAQGHPNDPRTDTLLTDEGVVWAGIMEPGPRGDKNRIKVADYFLRYVDEYYVAELINAYIRGDKEDLYVKMGDILSDLADDIACLEE